jgi:thiamine kinase-like enzyme
MRMTRSDIDRYFLSHPYSLSPSLVLSSINPIGPFPTWVSYISAFLKSYAFVISIHPNLMHLRHFLEPLQLLMNLLSDETDSGVEWVQRLRDECGLKGRLWHRDMHFGNILADEEGEVRGIIDWEFAGVGVRFSITCSFFLGPVV